MSSYYKMCKLSCGKSFMRLYIKESEAIINSTLTVKNDNLPPKRWTIVEVEKKQIHRDEVIRHQRNYDWKITATNIG